MSDLNAAIRAKLASFFNEACLGGCGCEESRCDVYGFDEMRDAIVAVLGEHKPLPDEVGVSETGLICGCLPDGSDPYVAHDYPCLTVRAIAEKLGVEVADADPA